MNRNVEIKAKLPDREGVEAALGIVGAEESGVLIQHDTFFRCTTGRLKLRVFDDGVGQLIYYQRPDDAEATISRYSISETDDPENLLALLSGALGVIGEVRKTRHLYMLGQTRIHLDRVDGLGDLLEIEVVLSPDQTEEHGHRIMTDLVEHLGIAPEDMVSVAYVDMLAGVCG